MNACIGVLTGLMVAAVCLGPAATGTFAAYGNGAEIVSASTERQEQGDDATDAAAVSRDGRFVAFRTRASNFFADDDPDPAGQIRVGGIFRRDLQTGRLELVADGDFRKEESPNDLLIRGAGVPSINGDGRFVAFSTAQRLVPQDMNTNLDVYVRDMSVPIRAAGAFDLVSARDGGDLSAAYEAVPEAREGGDPGSDISPGTAISDDGQRVVFRTVAKSDLPARVAADAEAFQVLHRDRAGNRTTLVTRDQATGEPAGGAFGQAGISGDGSTVIWTGRNAPAQTRFIRGETPDELAFYYLWRRVDDGPSAPTRRITGAVDPDDPACTEAEPVIQEETVTGPCYGPLTRPERSGSDILSLLPVMSANGRRVAFLTGAGPRPNPNTQPNLDLYLTDMSRGVSRKAGTIELTRDGAAGDRSQSGPIDALAITGDGRRLVVGTARTRFVLPALQLIGRPAEDDFREIYTIDLEQRTIERATRSLDGGEINGDVGTLLSVSDDASRIAFISAASNFFFGDANDRRDAFALRLAPEAGPETPVPPPPPPPDTNGRGGDPDPDPPSQEAKLTLRASSRADGTVLVVGRAPAAGRLTVRARFRPQGRGRRRTKEQTLASATANPRRAGSVRVVLKPTRRFRAELKRRRRIATTLRASFVPKPGGKRVNRRLRATFQIKSKSRPR